jgi:hypothetical protein
LLVLQVMIEHCSDGSSCRASISRYAAYSGCSDRKVQYVLRALCRRGELTQLSPGIAAKRRPAVYRINEAAMEENPSFEFSFDGQGRRVAKYRTRQEDLPGIPLPWDPKIPDEALAHPPGAQRAPVHGVQGTGAQDAPEGVHGVQGTGAQRAPDPKAFDPRALKDPKEGDSARARATSLSSGYTQSDFDARDLRKMASARRAAEERPSSVGSLSDREYFVWLCAHAGITVERGLQLEKLQYSWPSEIGSKPKSEGAA